MKLGKLLLLVGILSLLAPFSVYAAINITNRTGDIKIIMPDGTQVVVKADEALPEIPDGARIEVVSGTANIETTESSYVQVTVGGDTVNLGMGSSISVNLDTVTGVGEVRLESGTATVTTADGSTVALDSNNPVFYVETEAAAAAGEEPEVPPVIEPEESARDISPSS